MVEDGIKYIADHYGLHHQLQKSKEEILEYYEAIVEVETAMRIGTAADVAKALNHLAEEGADTHIMLDQVSYLTHTEKVRENFRKFKIDRQLKRIETGVQEAK